MQEVYDNELSKDVREKMKKNLVYVSIFSIIMLFAGFTSAYIVSMGDSFWLKYPLPVAFTISTILIVLSSIVLQISINKGVKGNNNAVKIGTLLTLLLGIGFAVYQIKGYEQLIENGANPVNRIMVSEGRYGDYYQLKIDGKFLEIDGNNYSIAGKPATQSQKDAISDFSAQLINIQNAKEIKLNGFSNYELLYKNKSVKYTENGLFVSDSIQLQFVDLQRLNDFAVHLKDQRGDFFHKGQIGKDFHIFYKGKELQYKDRTLMYNGVKLSTPLQLSLNGASDTSTAFLYIITILHFLHIIGALIYLIRMSIRSFTGTLVKNEYLSLRLGGIFWHFLGVLWIYLLLFLLFIH